MNTLNSCLRLCIAYTYFCSVVILDHQRSLLPLVSPVLMTKPSVCPYLFLSQELFVHFKLYNRYLNQMISIIHPLNFDSAQLSEVLKLLIVYGFEVLKASQHCLFGSP